MKGADASRSIRAVTAAAFALACAIGVVGAFVGLETTSFWVDEMHSAWMADSRVGVTAVLHRIATDVHPPVYILSLHLYTDLLGSDDAILRSFSAVCAVAAVVLFLWATRRYFTVPARLFAAAMATGSGYWFFQSQNVRPYALCLLLGTAMLALGLDLVRLSRREGRFDRATFAALATVMFTGSFVQFYVMYESIAVLVVIALVLRRHWLPLAGLAVALAASSALYVKLIVASHSQIALDHSWVGNGFGWYLYVLQASRASAAPLIGCLAIIVSLGVACLGRPAAKTALAANDGGADHVSSDIGTANLLAYLLGVPALVALAGFTSSVLVAPNVSDKSLLLCLPFFWAFCAWVYDAAERAGRGALFNGLSLLLAIAVLWMAGLVVERVRPRSQPVTWSEPFRQSAQWILAQPACRGQAIPVVTADVKSWYKPGYGNVIYDHAYGYYLHGYARPTLLYLEDIVAGRIDPALVATLRRRADGAGCPALLWTVHGLTSAQYAAVRAKLVEAMGLSATDASLRTLEFADGHVGYILAVAGR